MNCRRIIFTFSILILSFRSLASTDIPKNGVTKASVTTTITVRIPPVAFITLVENRVTTLTGSSAVSKSKKNISNNIRANGAWTVSVSEDLNDFNSQPVGRSAVKNQRTVVYVSSQL